MYTCWLLSEDFFILFLITRFIWSISIKVFIYSFLGFHFCSLSFLKIWLKTYIVPLLQLNSVQGQNLCYSYLIAILHCLYSQKLHKIISLQDHTEQPHLFIINTQDISKVLLGKGPSSRAFAFDSGQKCISRQGFKNRASTYENSPENSPSFWSVSVEAFLSETQFLCV